MPFVHESLGSILDTPISVFLKFTVYSYNAQMMYSKRILNIFLTSNKTQQNFKWFNNENHSQTLIRTILGVITLVILFFYL